LEVRRVPFYTPSDFCKLLHQPAANFRAIECCRVPIRYR
jgi:hypothetical protein